jgi:hypothetical protein
LRLSLARGATGILQIQESLGKVFSAVTQVGKTFAKVFAIGGLNRAVSAVKKFGSDLRLSLARGATGILQIQESLGKVFSAVTQVGKTFAKVFAIGALVLFGATFEIIMRSIRESMGLLFERAGLTPQIDGIKARFAELQLAVANAFLPLITAALPYIKIAISWLTDLFNKIAMITAALLGQREVMQIVAGSARNMSKDTKAAAKEMKGALAAFDQINILDKKPAEAGPDLTTADTVATRMVPITADILDKVQQIKDTIAAWWNDPVGQLQQAWDSAMVFIGQAINNFMDAIFPKGTFFRDRILDPLSVGFFVFVESTKKLFADLWKTITDDSLTLPEKIQKSFTILKTWVDTNFLPGMNNIMDSIFPPESTFRERLIDPLSVGFFVFVESTRKLFTDMWAAITSDSLTVPEKIKAIFGALGTWFDTNFGATLRAAFNNALTWLQERFNSVFSGVRDFARSVLNSIIGYIERLTQSIASGINAIIDGVNALTQIRLPGFSIGASINRISAPSIPRLATGAVIPPNAQFAAILGDQKSGMNIEAPADLIRQIVREEIGGASNDMTVTMPVYLDGEKIYENQQKVSTRRGGSLIKSGAVT